MPSQGWKKEKGKKDTVHYKSLRSKKRRKKRRVKDERGVLPIVGPGEGEWLNHP